MDEVDWLKRGLGKPGKTQAGLARQLRLNPSAISRMLKRARRLKASEVPAAARYLEEPPAYDVNEATLRDSATNAGQPGFQNEVSDEDAPRLPPAQSMPQDLEVLGTVEAGGGTADFDLNGQVVDRVRRPPALQNSRDAFALFVVGNSMEPRYGPGDLVFVHPGRPVTRGCDVLVELHGAPNGYSSPALIKIFISRSSDKVVLEQYNPAKRLTIPARQVKRILRILRPAELFGV